MTNGGRQLSGFRDLQQIFEGTASCVFRALRIDGAAVILKVLKAAVPSQQDMARVQHEFEVTETLDHEGVIRLLDLQMIDGSPVLVFEDFGAHAVAFQPPATLDAFLKIAIQAARALGYVHGKGVLHKDISPGNIVWNPSTGVAKLIDFGIAGRLTHADSGMLNPNHLEGSPPYLAPEQSGRMNRIMDYRSDYYGLGATLYHLLCKRPPFESEDLMELIHSHLAKSPAPPHMVDPNIPEAVSRIIMKLLAKEQEDRYQSAAGLVRDLEICRSQWREKGAIDNFTPGARDYSPKLTMPGKLYGREREIARISHAFENFQSQGSGMVLIAGYSGIGKTSLVKELFKPITRERGYFAEGKYDQLQRNVPWSGLARAFNGLIGQLLSRSETELAILRDELREALGSNGRVIIDIIPDVEMIIGPQGEVRPLGAAESQNRFLMVFQNFVEVICRLAAPLVVFLDDLQWVDNPSLNLIEAMMSDHFSENLLLIGSYRDNEVDATHPLMLTRKKLLEQDRIHEEIALTALGVEPITQWLRNLLKLEEGSGEYLAALVQTKTGGNPFFINQFLKTLNQEKALVLDPDTGWRWDTAKIEALNITDNVVDLMVRKMHRFPEATRREVSVASCLGNRFDIEVLAKLMDHSAGETLLALLPVIEEGLLFPLSSHQPGQSSSNFAIGYYRFMHDRVQQAGYVLLDVAQRREYHLKIGRLLRDQYLRGDGALLFEVVDHLNSAVDLLQDDDERLQLAELSLDAARKAKNSSAYTVAKTYLEQGLTALKAVASGSQIHESAYRFYLDLGEVVYLTGDFDTAAMHIEEAFKLANSPLKKAALHFLNSRIHMMNGRYRESLGVDEQALSLIGMSLPAEGERAAAIETEIQRVMQLLEGRSIHQIVDDPELTDEAAVLKHEILLNMILVAFFISEMELYSLLIVMLARTSLEDGLTPASATGLAFLGNILASRLKRYRTAYELGRVSIKIAERFNHMGQKGQCSLMFASYLNHWCAPVKVSETVAAEGYRCALEGGSLNWAGYNLWSKSWAEMFQGKPLDQVYQSVQEGLAFGDKTKNEQVVSGLLAMDLVLSNLLGKTSGPLEFRSKRMTEAEFLKRCEAEGPLNAVGFRIWKAQALFIMDHLDEAAQAIREAGEWIDIIIGHYHNAEFHFYRPLILISQIDRNKSQDPEADWALIQADRDQLAVWAETCPQNFLHKLKLVDAEIGRYQEHEGRVMDLFEEALDLAAENGFVQDEALISELAAWYWDRQDRHRFARMYRQGSEEKYKRWGLHAKTLLRRASVSLTSSGGESGDLLDLRSILKFSNAISNEIRLEELLTTIMRIVIENGGAERGFLLLEKKDGWYIEAEGAVNSDDIHVLQSIPLEIMHSHEEPILSAGVVTYTIRRREALLLDDAANDARFARDRYMVTHAPKSLLSMPLIKRGRLIGVLYLENNLNTGAFSEGHLEILRLLSVSTAVSIENARLVRELNLYSRNLEKMVADRTAQLDARNHELHDKNEAILKAQNQLVVSEKMATLGTLTAGVAHEFNNPNNFIYGSIQNLEAELRRYQKNLHELIEDEADEDVIAVVFDPLDKMLEHCLSVKEGSRRIQAVVDSMRQFSRLDEAVQKNSDLLEGLKATMELIQSQWPWVVFEVEPGPAMLANCRPAEVNQVYLNLILNACQSIDERREREVVPTPGRITGRGYRMAHELVVEITDNGVGIPREHEERIYEAFFTTKPPGRGMGLGLYSVWRIMEAHNGRIQAHRAPGGGATFKLFFPAA